MKKIIKILFWIVILLVIVLTVPLSTPGRTVTPQYNIEDLKFPSEFFWGSATAAHQVEGNLNNSLTQFEKDNAERLARESEARVRPNVPDWEAIRTEATDPANYISGITTDHYNRYPQDIQLMKQIGLNSYRFSIEWSRIEPEDGQFNQQELNHYRTKIQALKANGIEPFVTLWHRTAPVWVLAQGDWESADTIQDYKEFVEYVAGALGPEIKYWITFNEPILHVVAGYVQGDIPPQVRSFGRGMDVLRNMIEAHKQAYEVIHRVDSDAQVGSTQAMQIGEGSPNTVANQILTSYLDHIANEEFVDKTKNQTDFYGVQYYGPTRYTIAFGEGSLVKVKGSENADAKVRSDAGREVYPAGIYELIMKVNKRYQKPIIITENGIADRDDDLRGAYMSDHLYWVKKAMDEGADVRGYFVWSLMDNFEWISGRWPRFGLIEVDYEENLRRTIRNSADVLKKIIENK